MFKAQFDTRFLDLLLQPGLRTDQVLDELRHPPDGRVTMQTLQSGSKVFWDSEREVRGSGVKTVDNGQLHYLDVPVMSLTCAETHHISMLKFKVGMKRKLRWSFLPCCDVYIHVKH